MPCHWLQITAASQGRGEKWARECSEEFQIPVPRSNEHTGQLTVADRERHVRSYLAVPAALLLAVPLASARV
jgi:hypothetical protein